jgi:hypothetical protein
MPKPGKFSFIKNDGIRLSYEYAYKSATENNLWPVLKEHTFEQLFEDDRLKGLKLRKGTSYAATIKVLHAIAHEGWEKVVEQLQAKQDAGNYFPTL